MPTFEQAMIKALADGLRNIEENISKYVRMKVLMRRGMMFTKEEMERMKGQNKAKACASIGRRCQ